ncbi:MAG: DUF2065 domain-containing protein [Methylotenera sp.]|nr:DUF2065 domain-containing protein [Methylotenera sp.]
MKDSLLIAFSLMLILEGLMPLLLPQAWRDTFKRMVELKDGQLRFVGLISIVAGLLLYWIAR